MTDTTAVDRENSFSEREASAACSDVVSVLFSFKWSRSSVLGRFRCANAAQFIKSLLFFEPMQLPFCISESETFLFYLTLLWISDNRHGPLKHGHRAQAVPGLVGRYMPLN